MPNSPIRKLVPYAEKAERNGKKVIRLNIGQPDIPTSDKALAAIRNMDVKVIEYSHSAGMESLRRKMAEYYEKNKFNLPKPFHFDGTHMPFCNPDILFMNFIRITESLVNDIDCCEFKKENLEAYLNWINNSISKQIRIDSEIRTEAYSE
mgnify:CR=1 FL=1